MDTRPRIWLFGISKLRDVIQDVAADYIASVDLRVIAKGFEDAVQAVESAGPAEAPDIVISAGSNGSYLKARLAMPVILIAPTGFDVMHALERARRIDTSIGLVMHGQVPAEMRRFLSAFDANVDSVSYLSAEDAEIRVMALKDRGVKVIVGPGLVTELAEKAGLDSVFLYSRTSVSSALDRALEVVQANRSEFPRSLSRYARTRAGRAHPGALYRIEDMLGACDAIEWVKETLRRYAKADATVLIVGETGTGKEVAAQALHRASARKAFPFVAINCGALPETLLESELFGYEEGAFTGARRGGKPGLIESADRGTVFLDEIAEMPAALQSRLLRVIQEREVVRLGGMTPIPVDVRFVTATHRPLADAVADRSFRADLFYRLNILRIALPPLRERGADIGIIAAHLLVQAKATTSVAEAASALAPVQALLDGYHWPGNVREVQNLMTRIVVESDGRLDRLSEAWLRNVAPELGQPAMEGAKQEIATLRQVGRQSEADAARAVLQSFDGDRDRTARALGISKTTLWRRLRPS
ncbi:propionate catabolism operon regulatory protein PrpR [Robbsia sp. KACC 23696]|uniref:propionate catabolism operon regulatory protein PrpR n=1 Tax=Robbsia sp. KACC 23696 TaxID=3149231 RepID=UPI00325A795B